MNKRVITPEMLREFLEYDPDTGLLRWKARDAKWFNQTRARSKEHASANWNSKFSGKPAIRCLNSYGYLHGNILNTRSLAHRVAWAIYHGAWPHVEVDHINTVRSDNRIHNLRLATRSENGMNTNRRLDNTSGYKGVSWDKSRGLWQVGIRVDGLRKHLGRYPCKEQAREVYMSAALEMFGEFRNYG